MSPSFDCVAASSLLCSEDNNSLMCLDESDVWGQENHLNYNQNRSFLDNGDSCLMGASPLREESISLMVETESQHLPRYDYLGRLQSGELDSSMRRDAVEWIFKVIFNVIYIGFTFLIDFFLLEMGVIYNYSYIFIFLILLPLQFCVLRDGWCIQ